MTILIPSLFVEKDAHYFHRIWIHDVPVFSVLPFAEADPTWPFYEIHLQMQQNSIVCETELTQGRKRKYVVHP